MQAGITSFSSQYKDSGNMAFLKYESNCDQPSRAESNLQMSFVASGEVTPELDNLPGRLEG